MSIDTRIDAYIEKAAPFAQEILSHLRQLVQDHCPDVKETLKWGCPHFEYKGKILFSMAAFKQHCACGFRLATVMNDPHGLFQLEDRTAMGHLGRITSVKDLPSGKILAWYIKEAVTLTDLGARPAKVDKQVVAPPEEVPDYFIAALKKNKKALAVFEQFAPSHRKEYLDWITEAKREETRNKRMEQAIEWMAEGKNRHWKYK